MKKFGKCIVVLQYPVMWSLVILVIFFSHSVMSQDATKNELPNFDSPAVFQVTQPVDHGEGPMWDGRKNLLYFVDIHAGRVLSYNYDSKKVSFVTLKGDVSSVIPAKKNENILVLGLDRSLMAIEWDGQNDVKSKRVLTTVAPQFPQSRFNDGKADKQGRLWVGTMGFENPQTRQLAPNQGALYKITKDTFLSPKIEIAPVNISNGLTWNKANNKMYYIDTPSKKVMEYDYDDEKGDISNPRVSVDIEKFPSVTGSPDGMTIDNDDNLWIALFGGGSIIKVNPVTGQLLQVVPIPARDVTSVMFGGPNLDILFVTTSRRGLTDSERKTSNAAGSVFGVTNLRTKGSPAHFVDLVDNARRANILAEILINTNELFAQPLPNEVSNALVQSTEASQNYVVQQPQRTSEKEDVPFWGAILNTIRNFF
ncbi:regucalcin-like isoform X3 [Sitophilus oryzae]|uniref:Regucalcin n=1 Tax=Sitophilus oryzae TaxID=7048 RepID=A0A6J2YCU9_SITOR|nr:regucalcin-like isoform X3 [Sitophilus oryzae]